MTLFSYLLDAANWTLAPDGILTRIGQHLLFTFLAVGIAAVISIPLGILIGHTGKGDLAVIGVSNAARSIPTLGLLVLTVLLIGTNLFGVLLPLTVLAIPPILTATAAGVRGADGDAVHAARALGMTPMQVVGQVEWPLALPLVISGLRSASLQVVATATVAAYATAGGLGRLVLDGQRLGAGGYPQMFAGALLVALLAIVLDGVLGGIGWVARRQSRPHRSRDTSSDSTETTEQIALAPAG